MQEKKLNGMRVAILVTDDFEQAELAEPKKALYPLLTFRLL